MVYYDHEPEQVKYEVRPDGKAEVWIRRDIRQESTPEGGQVWVAEEVHFQTVQTQAEIVANADVLFFRNSDVRKVLTDVMQDYMDTVAQERGYDTILSLISYENSSVDKYAAEAAAGKALRDAVWPYCYEIEAAVLAGTSRIPTKEELLANAPRIVWPDQE